MKCFSLLPFLVLFRQIQGSTEMIQKFLPTGQESTICFPEEKLTTDSTVTWFYVDMTVATYYPNGDTKVMQSFTGKVKLPKKRCLMFLSPQKSDSGFYFAKVAGDRSEVVAHFNVTFQDQNTETTVAPAVSPAVLVLAIIAAAAAVGVGLHHYLKKRKLLCFAQDQKGAVLFSANSGTNSPTVQIRLQPPQANGDSHQIEENTGGSPV